MSKERLEKIRKGIELVDKYEVSDRTKMVDFRHWSYELLKIAVEQSERVEELEKDLLELVKQNKELRKSIAFYSSESYNAHLERLLDRREQQNKRYREALEQIANSDGWLIEPNPLCTVEEAYERCVDVAEKALEGEE